jgi:amino acid transporter
LNVATDERISRVAQAAALLKLGGVLVFALATRACAGMSFQPAVAAGAASAAVPGPAGGVDFIAAVALGILAFKGFATISSSGAERVDPRRCIGTAIVVSLAIRGNAVLLAAWAVGSTLSMDEIAAARDLSLAEAPRPALGRYGTWFTAGVAIVAAASGPLAGVLVVPRLLGKLTKTEMVPHRPLGGAGRHADPPAGLRRRDRSAADAVLRPRPSRCTGWVCYLLMDMST